MKLLICPQKRPGLGHLAQKVPLAQIPILGQTLVEYWLAHLAGNKCKEVTFLANDRPDTLRALLDDGARWGMTLEVITESRELTPAEALIKYDKLVGSDQSSIAVVDHLPNDPPRPLFDTAESFFAGIRAWMPFSRMPDRIGVRQVSSGIWAGLRARVSSSARITPPCWLGKSVFIGPGAQIGPGAIIEDGSLIEPGTEIVESYVGSDTLVGEGTIIRDSLAWGNTLINWKTGSVAEVPDAFILCALRRPQAERGRSWIERLTEMCAPDNEEDLFIKDLLIKKESSS